MVIFFETMRGAPLEAPPRPSPKERGLQGAETTQSLWHSLFPPLEGGANGCVVAGEGKAPPRPSPKERESKAQKTMCLKLGRPLD